MIHFPSVIVFKQGHCCVKSKQQVPRYHSGREWVNRNYVLVGDKEWMITPHCIQLCLSLLYLSYSVTDSVSDITVNFIYCGLWSLFPCLLRLLPGESTKCFYWFSCSVLSGGILHVGTTLRCCWQRREAERIIPDDRGIKCVAGRWRPELMLSCLFWFSTSSEAVPSKLRGSSQYSERCAVH